MIIELKSDLKVVHGYGSTIFRRGAKVNWSCSHEGQNTVHRVYAHDPVINKVVTTSMALPKKENPKWL